MVCATNSMEGLLMASRMIIWMAGRSLTIGVVTPNIDPTLLEVSSQSQHGVMMITIQNIQALGPHEAQGNGL